MSSEYIRTNKRGDVWFQLGNIFSIKKVKDGYEFAEECDYYFKEIHNKEKSIDILNRAIEYIEKSV